MLCFRFQRRNEIGSSEAIPSVGSSQIGYTGGGQALLYQQKVVTVEHDFEILTELYKALQNLSTLMEEIWKISRWPN